MVTVPILGTDLHPRDPNPSPLVGMSHKCGHGTQLYSPHQYFVGIMVLHFFYIKFLTL